MTDNMLTGLLLLSASAGALVLGVQIYRHGVEWLFPRLFVAEVKGFTCGCPTDGRPGYWCMYCGRTSCEPHRDRHGHPDERGPVADADRPLTVLAEDFERWQRELPSDLRRKARKLGGPR